MTRLIVVDDHEIVRVSLALLLDETPGFEVVGMAAGVRDGTTLLEKLVPDVAIVDLSLEDGNATEFLRLVRRERLPCRILILTGVADRFAIAEMLREGAAGYVIKSQPASELVDAVRIVAAGGRYLPAAPPGAEQGPAPACGLEQLSRRESEIFRLVAAGFRGKDIARRLFISVKTVETHRTNINRKLDLRTNGDLIRFAAVNGIEIAPQPDRPYRA